WAVRRDGCCNAARKRGGKQLVRRRATALAAEADRLVRHDLVSSVDQQALLERTGNRMCTCRQAHRPKLHRGVLRAHRSATPRGCGKPATRRRLTPHGLGGAARMSALLNAA